MKFIATAALSVIGFLLIGCAITPNQFKTDNEASQPISSTKSSLDLAECLLPHLEETKFFVTGDQLTANMRRIKNGWQIYGVTGDYTMYVVDVMSVDGNLSTATLYSRKQQFGVEMLQKNFIRGMKLCNE